MRPSTHCAARSSAATSWRCSSAACRSHRRAPPSQAFLDCRWPIISTPQHTQCYHAACKRRPVSACVETAVPLCAACWEHCPIHCVGDLQEFMAALLVLDTVVRAEYLKPFWGCWAYPAPLPAEAGAGDRELLNEMIAEVEAFPAYVDCMAASDFPAPCHVL